MDLFFFAVNFFWAITCSRCGNMCLGLELTSQSSKYMELQINAWKNKVIDAALFKLRSELFNAFLTA